MITSYKISIMNQFIIPKTGQKSKDFFPFAYKKQIPALTQGFVETALFFFSEIAQNIGTIHCCDGKCYNDCCDCSAGCTESGNQK